MSDPGMETRSAALERVLEGMGRAAVAVSGGVDSMTLAVVAHRTLGDSASMLHAVSAAVPADATDRVERYARREGWRLRRIDAGELLDARYVANPVNRCYFCKTELYGKAVEEAASLGIAHVLDGFNLDDRGDHPDMKSRSPPKHPIQCTCALQTLQLTIIPSLLLPLTDYGR